MDKKEEKETGNGCVLNKCEFFVNSRCLSDDDMVSRIDGQPICKFNPNAILYSEYKNLKEWEDKQKYLEEDREEHKKESPWSFPITMRNFTFGNP